MKTTELGHGGEDKAVLHLTASGFKILERNWKTRVCEIDIVARRNKIVYFVEVKARQTTRYGMGIEYITPKKLEQMRFAAEVWVHAHGWQGAYQLSAIGVDGDEITFIEDVL